MIKYKHIVLTWMFVNLLTAIYIHISDNPMWLVVGNILSALLLLWVYLNEINIKHHRPEKCWVNRKPWVYYYADKNLDVHRKVMKIKNGRLIVLRDEVLTTAGNIQF